MLISSVGFLKEEDDSDKRMPQLSELELAKTLAYFPVMLPEYNECGRDRCTPLVIYLLKSLFFFLERWLGGGGKEEWEKRKRPTLVLKTHHYLGYSQHHLQKDSSYGKFTSLGRFHSTITQLKLNAYRTLKHIISGCWNFTCCFVFLTKKIFSTVMVHVNCSLIIFFSHSGKYAQVTNNPENDGCINAVLLV